MRELILEILRLSASNMAISSSFWVCSTALRLCNSITWRRRSLSSCLAGADPCTAVLLERRSSRSSVRRRRRSFWYWAITFRIFTMTAAHATCSGFGKLVRLKIQAAKYRQWRRPDISCSFDKLWRFCFLLFGQSEYCWTCRCRLRFSVIIAIV